MRSEAPGINPTRWGRASPSVESARSRGGGNLRRRDQPQAPIGGRIVLACGRAVQVRHAGVLDRRRLELLLGG
jgi:hypothetical protein